MQSNNYDDFHIENSQQIIEVYTAGTGKKTITVAGGMHLEHLLLVKDACDLDLRIESAGEGAQITVKVLCLAKEGSNISLKLHGHLFHDHATADLHMITLLDDGAVCEIDGGVDLHANVKKISGHLLEENIILGDRVHIKTLPMLDVHSSDVSASHGARIERLDEKKLFYLQSRGLDATQAKELMISGYFEQVFASFVEKNPDLATTQQEWLAYLLE